MGGNECMDVFKEREKEISRLYYSNIIFEALLPLASIYLILKTWISAAKLNVVS